jgi:hypothetical protein
VLEKEERNKHVGEEGRKMRRVQEERERLDGVSLEWGFALRGKQLYNLSNLVAIRPRLDTPSKIDTYL